MKKTIVILIMLYQSIFAIETEIKMDSLKPISFENNIDILFVEDNLNQIETEMGNYESKNSFYYNYVYGKLNYKKGNREMAIKYFNQALKYEENNLSLRMELLEIYVVDIKYKEEAKKNIDYLEKQNLSDREKNLFNELKSLYMNSLKIQNNNQFELSLLYNDNLNFDKDKNSELYTNYNLVYNGIKKLEFGIFKFQGNIGGKSTFNSVGKSGLNFYGGADYTSKYKNLNYNIPLYLDFQSINSNELKLATGISYFKNLDSNNNITMDLSSVMIINDNFSGWDVSLGTTYKVKKAINYILDAQYIMAFYTENIYERDNFSASISFDKIINDTYYIFGKYKYEYINSEYQVQGKKRKDIINSIKLGYEQNIKKEDLKLNVNYSYSYDLPNYDGYESSQNILSTSLIWEF